MEVFHSKFKFVTRLSLKQKISLLFLISALILVITTSLLYSRPIKSSKTRASVTSIPNVDPQTGEYYDLQIEAFPKTIVRTEPGPNNISETIFHLGGERILNFQQVYGYIQNPATPYEPNSINFSLQSTIQPRFISMPVNLLNNGCIDLYSSPQNTQENYIATYCYKITYINPNTTNGIAYSSSSNPYINYSYNGSQTTTLLFLTTAFNKYNNPYPHNGINIKGTRVNYLTIDSHNSSLNSFINVKYFIQGLTGGLTPQQYNNLCTIATNLPSKYLKQTTASKPEGGSNLQITISLGACNFQYDSSYLKPFYLSLDMEGGVPYPLPTPTITLTPSPTPKPTLTPTATPTNTPTPIPTNTPTPTPTNTPTPRPTLTPTPTRGPWPTTKITPRITPRVTPPPPCKTGLVRPYFKKILWWCVMVDACGKSSCSLRPTPYPAF